MIAGLIYLSFKSLRQISLFIIMCAPILSMLITDLSKIYDDKLIEKIYNFSTSIFGSIVIVLIVFIFTEQKYKDIKSQQYINDSVYPVEASLWIKENLDLETLHLYDEYNFGSYLLYEGIPVFIDSRCDLYTPQFNGDNNLDIFTDSLNVPNLSDDYEKIFNKYGVNYAIFYSGDAVCKLLNQDNNYSIVYEDEHFIIYNRLNYEG